MASSPTAVHPESKGNIPKSRFKQTARPVCLADWWLVKTDNDLPGRRLAVAGFTCRENRAMRVFSSAPILQRYDTFTAETTDGIFVIFKGFINKSRTVANGFPYDVFNHFVFGFPPYWKEYDENVMARESSSNDISGSNFLKIPSPLSKIVSGQPHADNCQNDLESQCKIDVKRVQQKLLGKKSECNLLMPCIAPKGLEDKPYSMDPISDYHPTPDVKNTMESLSGLSVNDEAVYDSQVKAAGGVLLACHLVSKPTENSPTASCDKDVSSSRDIPSNLEGRVRTRSTRSLKMKQNNDKRSSKILGGEKIKSNCEPEIKTTYNVEVFEFHGSEDNIKPSGFESGVVEDESVQVSRTPDRDSEVKKGDNVKKAKSKANTSSGTKTKRKLAYETPDREKDETCASPQCMSFNRSRSGRLLMPSLDFWRNQKAIYDVGEQLLELKKADTQNKNNRVRALIGLSEHLIGSTSTLKRKRGRPKVKGI